MKPEKLNLNVELNLSAPLSRHMARDPCVHEKVVKRLQSVLDEMGEEDTYFHNEIMRLKEMQEHFLRGQYVY